MENTTGVIKSNSEIRAEARSQLKGNWGNAVLLCAIYMVIIILFNASTRVIPYIGMVVNWIVMGPLMLGLVACFVKLVRKQEFRYENLFDGFSRFSTAFVAQLLVMIFTMLWSLLLLIPGIIAALGYAMTFYIINDNPELSASRAIEESKKMMYGYRWKLFCLNFSFIGWGLLCIFTFGIGYLWLTPYMQASLANFYENLKDSSIQKTTI